MKYILGLVALLLLYLDACLPSPSPSVQTVIPTIPAAVLSPTPIVNPAKTESGHRVEISVFGENAETLLQVPAGSTATVFAAFRPTKDVIESKPGATGAPLSYSTEWTDHSIRQMRYCSGLAKSCALPDVWVPFSNQVKFQVPIDWIGTKDFTVAAQFRDSNGAIVHSGQAQEAIGSNSISIVSTLDERTPEALQPPAIQTAISQLRDKYPVTGSIQVGERDRVGARAGTTLSIPVKFAASSPAGPVSEMRVLPGPSAPCLAESEMTSSKWEPFSSSRVYTYQVAINWTTFHLNVQYRDSKGNLSPVYCGQVAVEGSP